MTPKVTKLCATLDIDVLYTTVESEKLILPIRIH